MPPLQTRIKITTLICLSFLCLLSGFFRLGFAYEAPSEARYGVGIRPVMVAMPDGVKLALDLYLPEGADAGARFPVLFEYYPYRKTSFRDRNFPLYSYFVKRGYVVAVADVRGTGNSEGMQVPLAYSDQEHQDGDALIDWLSKQPWSNHKVGMFGISYSGFNAIQMAMRQPPALKTILAVDATESLYQEDVYFIDGIMHLDSYEMLMDVDNARPGAPDYKIDDVYFKQRFDRPPFTIAYKKQQRDGAFWDRASLLGRYDKITVPSFHIGGWYDGYRNSIPRMLQNLKAPVKAIIGPWIHSFPHDAYPEPAIEWRHEAVRWFDYWLKGIDTGIMQEPKLAVYVRNWHPPGPYMPSAPGQWRYEDGWPIARTQPTVFYPKADHQLAQTPGQTARHSLHNTPTAGMEAGGPVMWWGDVAHDQRPTDAFSLTYDSAPFSANTEILGRPQAVLKMAADAPRANWFVRLSDIAPDGRVTLITGAGANGTHRISARQPQDIVPGQPFELTIDLHNTSWVFEPGHRMRLSISNAQWPMFWPTPHPLTTDLFLGEHGSRIILPVIPKAKRPQQPQFLVPEREDAMPGFASLDLGTTSGFGEVSKVERNPQTGETLVRATSHSGAQLPWGKEIYRELIEHRSSDSDPAHTSVLGEHSFTVELPQRTLLWEGKLDFRSDADNFYYDYVRRLSENGKLIREKEWHEVIPRDFQ